MKKTNKMRISQWLGFTVLIAVILFTTVNCSKVREIPGMVWISAGTFTMGSPTSEPGRSDNETQHQVRVTRGFYMGKYPVTQAKYQAVMKTNPSEFKRSSGGDNPANRPVEQVSWYDAIVFCNRLSMNEGLRPAYRISGSTDPSDWGNVPKNENVKWNAVEIVASSNGYRLPTEAQWEYACRAGTTTAFNWGTNNISSSEANYDASQVDVYNTAEGTYIQRTTEVGSYAPNAWGLYDMHGNVYEWCWDWLGHYSSSAQADPKGAASGMYRVRRGGSWGGHGQSLRSAHRAFGYLPFGWHPGFGFRLVRP
jgi:formylglycine-generating enzyme required for sulfatase activity